MSNMADRRLTKEISLCRQSDLYNKLYTFELIGDNVRQWRVQLRELDNDARLKRDLQLLKEKKGYDFVELDFSFPADYPIAPPFVRVVRPVLSGGNMQPGGAFCLDILTKSGWLPTFSVESLILQLSINIKLTHVDFNGDPGSQYS